MSQSKFKIVSVSETIKAKDSLAQNKMWFDGLKKFLGVKVIPPKK